MTLANCKRLLDHYAKTGNTIAAKELEDYVRKSEPRVDESLTVEHGKKPKR